MPTICERLGYSPSTRLLIINADDFGMCHTENLATIEGIDAGAYTSSTIMVPCPWFLQAAAFARTHPTADLGVHITHTSEWDSFRWGPVSGRSAVASMVDAEGYLHRDVEPVYANAQLDQIERETRAQIERALDAGVDVTHLDSHMGTLQLDVRYHELYVRLAADYQLPIRMAAREMLRDMGMASVVAQAEAAGVLAPDVLWIGGPPAPDETAAYWTALFGRLKPGLTEVYVHAGLDHAEQRAVCRDWAQRVADHAFFTAPSTHRLLDDLGIIRVGYRALRTAQRQARG